MAFWDPCLSSLLSGRRYRSSLLLSPPSSVGLTKSQLCCGAPCLPCLGSLQSFTSLCIILSIPTASCSPYHLPVLLPLSRAGAGAQHFWWFSQDSPFFPHSPWCLIPTLPCIFHIVWGWIKCLKPPPSQLTGKVIHGPSPEHCKWNAHHFSQCRRVHGLYVTCIHHCFFTEVTASGSCFTPQISVPAPTLQSDPFKAASHPSVYLWRSACCVSWFLTGLLAIYH